MHSLPNPRLTQKGRRRLVTQHLEHGRRLKELAAENGISLSCAYRWLARYRSSGSSECSPHPAAEARSTASRVRRGSPPPAAQPAPH